MHSIWRWIYSLYRAYGSCILFLIKFRLRQLLIIKTSQEEWDLWSRIIRSVFQRFLLFWILPTILLHFPFHPSHIMNTIIELFRQLLKNEVRQRSSRVSLPSNDVSITPSQEVVPVGRKASWPAFTATITTPGDRRILLNRSSALLVDIFFSSKNYPVITRRVSQLIP